MADLVSLDEIRAAAARLRGVTIRTPLLAFPGAAGASGPPALQIKPESLQPTGAFKLRGAYNAISSLVGEQPGVSGVVAHSSGNHGFAVAYAAAVLGLPAAIVVPDTAPQVKTDLIRAVGAEIVTVAPTLAARIEASRRIANDRGYAEVPPFDDRRVIARFRALARLAIYPRRAGALGNARTGQHEVDAHAQVLVEHAGAVVPVGEDPLVRPAVADDVAQAE